jgi:hypothetical protein
MKDKKLIKSFNEATENLNISDVSDSLIRQGTFHMDVNIIKYDGTNKDFIINKLNIKSHIPSYFKDNPSYFIIPSDGDWFILDEKQFKRKVTLD